MGHSHCGQDMQPQPILHGPDRAAGKTAPAAQFTGPRPGLGNPDIRMVRWPMSYRGQVSDCQKSIM